MDWLNYNNLRGFWTTAREGGVGAAARKLRLSQPTISGQIRELERSLGVTLFERTGRRLALTAVGQRVFEQADEIFALGGDILRIARDRGESEVQRVVVGCADVLPKMVTYRLLEPALRHRVRIVARQDRLDVLLAELAINALDLVLADSPIPAGMRVRAFNHLLGESDVAIFATPAKARELARGFPRSMDGAEVLWPGAHTALRRSLDAWSNANTLAPRIIGEFDDSGLLKAFARAGAGAFAAPEVIAEELEQIYGVTRVGRCTGVRERFYAITLERRIRNPAVSAISAHAREVLVGPP